MQGLREAIEKIQNLSVEAMNARAFKAEGEPSGVYYLQTAGGKVEKVYAEAAPRAYAAFSLDGVCAMVENFSGRDRSISVFVGRGKIGVHLDESSRRRDGLTMDMPHSEAFLTLLRFNQAPNKMNQRQFVWLVRSALGEPTAPSGFLDGIRNLKFTKSSDGSSSVKVGKESLGNAVIAEVVGNGFAIPEEAVFEIPVYADVLSTDGALLTEVVRCVIDVDVDEGVFILKPRPGEMDRAQRTMDERICEMLSARLAGTATVFNGRL